MRFMDMLKTVIAERVINAVLDRATNGKRNKGSMYPFRLPKESSTKKPTRKEVKALVTNYFASSEGKRWHNSISTTSRSKTLYHADAMKIVRHVEKKATQALLKKIGLA